MNVGEASCNSSGECEVAIARTAHFAARAEQIPLFESSMIRAFSALVFVCSRERRYGSGWGFPFVISASDDIVE